MISRLPPSSLETFVQEQYNASPKIHTNATYQILLRATVVTCCVNNDSRINSSSPSGNNVSLFIHLQRNIAAKQCMKQCVLVDRLGNMTRKQCFLVCLFSGVMAGKTCLRKIVCMSSGKHVCERMFLLYNCFVCGNTT